MPPASSRMPWVDYLRGFITLLVVAHHASLAYTTFAQFNKDAYILSTHPVVDTVRLRALDIFVDFNDVFFMSLMFFISGLFVLPGLNAKGIPSFIRDRFFRLFIPFIAGVTLLMLLAYFPAWYLAHGNWRVKDYIIDFFTIESWPVGPPWFIWVLFVFNLAAALSYPVIQRLANTCQGLFTAVSRRPLVALLAWYAFTWILLVPMVVWAGPYTWTGMGPFDFQVSRVLLYLGYFILGALVGNAGVENSVLAKGNSFAGAWRWWAIACVVVYALLKWSEAPFIRLEKMGDNYKLPVMLAYRSVWALSCTLSCIAFLTVFQHLFRRVSPWWQALSANAYGIYLLHYLFIVWLQYLLLPAPLPAVIKMLLVFVISVAASWWLTALLRKIPLVKKYI